MVNPPQGHQDPIARAEIKRLKETLTLPMERTLDRTLERAHRVHTINIWINITTVAIGVALIGTSLVLSWIRQVDPYTIAFAAIGVADFVAIFLIGPQRGIAASLGDLNQIEMIYGTFNFELENLVIYANQLSKQKQSIEEISAFNREVEKVRINAVYAIEKYLGQPMRSSPNQQN